VTSLCQPSYTLSPRFSRVRTWQFCKLAGSPLNKNTSLGPLNAQKHQICRQLGQFFEPNRMTFKEWEGKQNEAAQPQLFCKEKTLKTLEHCFGGGRSFIPRSSLLAPVVLDDNPHEKKRGV